MARKTTAPRPAMTPTATARGPMAHQASGGGSGALTRCLGPAGRVMECGPPPGAAAPSGRAARGPGGQHGVDLSLGETGLAEHLNAVLPEARRQAPDGSGRLAVGGGNVGGAERALRGM